MPSRPVVTYPARVLKHPVAAHNHGLVVRGRTPEGQQRVIAAHGFEAPAFLRELDHLDGLLILDRIASARTDIFPRKRYAGPGEHLR